MAIPAVAIVGRPNVGKSSLFNWLAGRRIAIVDPTAGVTRDRVSTLITAEDRFFELIDTGGIGIDDVDNLTADVERQIQVAIDQADVILFVVDARAGLVPLDEEVAERLRLRRQADRLRRQQVRHPRISIRRRRSSTSSAAASCVCVSALQNRGKERAA